MAQIFSSSFQRIVFLLTALVWSAPLLAEAADFQVVPMLQEVVLHDESEARIEVAVTNTTDGIGTFRLRVLDFGSLDESGGVAFLGASNELETKYSLASWMRPQKDSVTLLPGKSETIPIVIQNRDSLAPGGHYGAIVFESADPPALETPNTIAVNQMIASLVFVKKMGGANPGLELAGVEHDRSLWGMATETTLRFHNPGNIHVVPRGMIRVTDPLKRVVYRGIVNEASAVVLPESFRLFPTSLFRTDHAWLPGKYMLAVEYRFEETADVQVWNRELFLFPPLAALASLLLAGMGGGFFFWKRYQGRTSNQTAS